MACKLPGYAGRMVLLEYFLACGDVDPTGPDVAWAPIGPMTTKAFNLTWETSDVSILNETCTAQLSDETAALLRSALRYADVTGGAFDVTIAPLVALPIGSAKGCGALLNAVLNVLGLMAR